MKTESSNKIPYIDTDGYVKCTGLSHNHDYKVREGVDFFTLSFTDANNTPRVYLVDKDELKDDNLRSARNSYFRRGMKEDAQKLLPYREQILYELDLFFPKISEKESVMQYEFKKTAQKISDILR